MNWEVIGIFAEIISAAAVVVTLVFLVIEIRSNRGATESAAIDAAATGFNTMNTTLISDPELVEIFLKAQAGEQPLSRVDLARVQLLLQSYINHYTTLKKYHDSGALPDRDWRSYSVAMAALTNSPGGEEICKKIEISEPVRKELDSYRGEETPYGWDQKA
jgi:hypothetical protein